MKRGVKQVSYHVTSHQHGNESKQNGTVLEIMALIWEQKPNKIQLELY